jgi:sialate O-acetylesterase
MTLLAITASSAAAGVRLSGMFSDHMVLQRNASCPLWGTADAGAGVEVSINGKTVAATTADTDGAFRVSLPALSEPGPHRIEVRSGNDVVALEDVLAGEVWLCSGQSNMELPTTRAVDGQREAAAATQPTIRLYQVPRAATTQPAADIRGKWVVATPQTAGAFSAVGYFFGRELNRELNVPVGLIHSSWSGTPAESWTPLPTLMKLTDLPRASAMAANVEASKHPDAAARFDVATRTWMQVTNHVDPGVSEGAKAWADPALDTSRDWKSIALPTDVTKHGVPSGSITWFRKDLVVPAEQAGTDLVLTLGVIDDFDTTFFNGEQVGATDIDTPSWWNAQRRYVVPGRLVKAGA